MTGTTTKREYLANQGGGQGLSGFYGDAAFDFMGWVQIGAQYEGYQHMPSTLSLFLNVPALDWLQFQAYYTRTDITGPGDVFKLDERSLALAQIKYEIISYVYLVGRYVRTWKLNTGTGSYDTVNDFNVGVETKFTF